MRNIINIRLIFIQIIIGIKLHNWYFTTCSRKLIFTSATSNDKGWDFDFFKAIRDLNKKIMKIEK